MSRKPRENRVPIMLTNEELMAIDDWRFANRVATRSAAIRKLVTIGLTSTGFPPVVQTGLFPDEPDD